MKIRTDKRTGIKFADYVVGGKRKRISLHTKNNEVAILKAAKIADDKDSKVSGRLSFEAFLVRYKEFLNATRKKGTIAYFDVALKNLLAYKNIKYLDEITPNLLDSLAVHLKAKGNRPAGLNRKIRALKTAIRQAEFWDLIPPQNWRKVAKFKEKKGRVEFHTPKEIKQILAIFNANWQMVVLLGARAGLRRGEIANLQWKDVDFKNNQLYIAPNKTEKHRYIPIAPDLRKALQKANMRKTSPFVVEVGENRQSPYYLSCFYKKHTAENLEFNCFLHKLRHTFASHLVQAGIDLYRVSKLLGHSSIKMTEIYAHLAPTDLKSAIKKLPKL